MKSVCAKQFDSDREYQEHKKEYKKKDKEFRSLRKQRKHQWQSYCD